MKIEEIIKEYEDITSKALLGYIKSVQPHISFVLLELFKNGYIEQTPLNLLFMSNLQEHNINLEVEFEYTTGGNSIIISQKTKVLLKENNKVRQFIQNFNPLLLLPEITNYMSEDLKKENFSLILDDMDYFTSKNLSHIDLHQILQPDENGIISNIFTIVREDVHYFISKEAIKNIIWNPEKQKQLLLSALKYYSFTSRKIIFEHFNIFPEYLLDEETINLITNEKISYRNIGGISYIWKYHPELRDKLLELIYKLQEKEKVFSIIDGYEISAKDLQEISMSLYEKYNILPSDAILFVSKKIDNIPYGLLYEPNASHEELMERILWIKSISDLDKFIIALTYHDYILKKSPNAITNVRMIKDSLARFINRSLQNPSWAEEKASDIMEKILRGKYKDLKDIKELHSYINGDIQKVIINAVNKWSNLSNHFTKNKLFNNDYPMYWYNIEHLQNFDAYIVDLPPSFMKYLIEDDFLINNLIFAVEKSFETNFFINLHNFGWKLLHLPYDNILKFIDNLSEDHKPKIVNIILAEMITRTNIYENPFIYYFVSKYKNYIPDEVIKHLLDFVEKNEIFIDNSMFILSFFWKENKEELEI